MDKLKVAFTNGYTSTPSSKRVDNLYRLFARNDISLLRIDPLRDIRKELLFRKSRLTTKTAASAVKTVESCLESGECLDLLICFSYGVVAVFQTKCYVKRMFIESPPLGTVKFSFPEKIASLLFPGFREMRNGKLKEKIFRRIAELQTMGTEITFFVPRKGYLYKDERISYSLEDIKRMKDLGEIITISVEEHKEAIDHPEVLKAICKYLEFGE